MHINNPSEGLITMITTIIALALALGANAPCEYEDGSGQRACIWDAKHMGNGEGKSGIILRGGTDRSKWIPIPHRAAHRILN